MDDQTVRKTRVALQGGEFAHYLQLLIILRISWYLLPPCGYLQLLNSNLSVSLFRLIPSQNTKNFKFLLVLSLALICWCCLAGFHDYYVLIMDLKSFKNILLVLFNCPLFVFHSNLSDINIAITVLFLFIFPWCIFAQLFIFNPFFSFASKGKQGTI